MSPIQPQPRCSHCGEPIPVSVNWEALLWFIAAVVTAFVVGWLVL